MTKIKNLELEGNVGENNMFEKSKNVKKKTKKGFEVKKKLKQVKNSDMAVGEATRALNGCIKTGDKKDKRTQGQAKEGIPPNGDKLLAKIEKKKAKKLAKKLKKQNEENELDSKKKKNEPVKQIAELSKPQQKMKIPKKKFVNLGKRDSDPAIVAATVFVGNLPINTKRIQLTRLFSDYGPVNSIRFRSASGKILYRHKQRKEAGTLNAYVVLKDEETASSALDLNGTVFKNNHLRITRADLKSTSMDAKRTIFIGNLKHSANEEKLREIFSSCGDIDYVRCIHDDKGCKGVAYVCFKAPEAVGLALELNETMLDERPIHVERYSVRKSVAKAGRDAKSGETKAPSAKGKKSEGKKLQDKESHSHPKDSHLKKDKFRGVKVDAMSKKQKKKKPTTQMQKLAKKIAPKEVLKSNVP